MLLHFLHALSRERRVTSFVFGTRLTNITRQLRTRDVDKALAAASAVVEDWSGGTRITGALHTFNRLWSRRVLGQGAIVLLVTDGLERESADRLGQEIDRLHRSCRRLIWLNPLLRYPGFAARAAGVKAMLPHVDSFRTIHTLESMEESPRARQRRGTGSRLAGSGLVRRPLGGGGEAIYRGDRSLPTKGPNRWNRERNRIPPMRLPSRNAGERRARGGAGDVVETWGSAPRGRQSSGYRRRGQFRGSVSGGCVEGRGGEALDLISAGGSKMLEFGVADETAWRVGLSCGGRIKVFVEKVE
jgi:hypothetical protein